jgi:hypothetical protein
MTAWFGQTASRIHYRRAKTNKNISCSDHGQRLLLLDCPMGDRTQYPWIESGVPCKLLRIRPVALAVVTTDGMQLGDVGDDHLVPVLFQLLRDSDRMNTGFHGNSNPIHIFKALRHAAFGRSEAALFRNLPVFIQHAVMTPLVS